MSDIINTANRGVIITTANIFRHAQGCILEANPQHHMTCWPRSSSLFVTYPSTFLQLSSLSVCKVAALISPHLTRTEPREAGARWSRRADCIHCPTSQPTGRPSAQMPFNGICWCILQPPRFGSWNRGRAFIHRIPVDDGRREASRAEPSRAPPKHSNYFSFVSSAFPELPSPTGMQRIAWGVV